MHLHRVRRGGLVVLLLLSVVAGAFTATPPTARADSATFENRSSIQIRDNNTAIPYPSSITVSGLSGVTSKVTVKLYEMTHPTRSDLDIMLVAPTGQKVMLFSDDGSGAFDNATITFSDDAPMFPNSSTLSGEHTFQPVNLVPAFTADDDVFPNPAPAGTPATTLEAFSGKDPNGLWRLFVRDDTASGAGTIGVGWDLVIETAPSVGGNTVTIPSVGKATPYASTITVANGYGIEDLRVTLFNVNHPNPDDLDVLLVGPGGQAVRLMSDAGGRDDLVNTTLSFKDDTRSRLPDQKQIVSGIFKPSNFGATDAFPAPAPAGPFSTTLSVFSGTAADGVWSLYVNDDLGGFRGSIGGWALGGRFNTGGIALTPPIGTQIVHPGSTMTLTAEFIDPDGDPITAVGASLPSFASYDATLTGVSVTIAPEAADIGTHPASLTLNDGFHLAVHSFDIIVPTSAMSSGPITIPTNGAATPYPSTISVAQMPGVIVDVTVAINSLSAYHADIEMMLVGPTGVAVELLSDCAPTNVVNDYTYTFSDDGAAWGNAGRSGTYKPIDCNTGADEYPSPAPTTTPAAALAAFDGTAPDGTWSLYVVDDEDPDGGSIESWSLAIDTNTPPTVDFPGIVTMGAGDTTEIQLFADDVDGDDLTWSVTNQPSFMTLIPNDDSSATMELSTDRLTSGVFIPTISVSDGFSTASGNIRIEVEREDETPPNVSAAVAPNAFWLKTDATVTLTATDEGSGVQDITYSATGAQPIAATTVDADTTQLMIGAEGVTTVRYTATDNLLNTSALQTRIVRIDKSLPTATAPVHTLAAGGQLGGSTAPVTISWSGVDVGPSGLKGYVLQQSIAGAAFTGVALPVATNTSITLDLSFGTLYQFRVRSVDRAGNSSAFATGDVFRNVPRQETGLTYSTTPGWAAVAQTGSFGGNVRRADALNATMSVGFVGKQIAWVGTMCNSCGLAEVSIDGTVVATVDLYRATTRLRTFVFVSDWLPSGSHTLSVRVLGDHSASSTGNTVDIDGFVIFPIVD